MGEVWKARDTRLDRSVAIKILPADYAANARLRLLFEREAKTVSQLNHPHIASLFDVGENYLVMELVDGESLAERLERGPLPLAEALKFGAQIADAIDRAHRAGVVHRDLKPGNVMIARGGAKLLDFGLAKTFAFAAPPDAETQRPITEEGTIVGTFQYMAPEQLEGHPLDARTDIFALGAVLYEMVTGKRAFDGHSRPSVIAAILSSEPQPVSQLQPLTPPALEHLIVKCLSKHPDDRWQSAHDIAEELRWIGSAGSQSGPMLALPRKKSRERVAWIAALLVIATIALFAIWSALRMRSREPVLEGAIVTDGNAGLHYTTGPPALSPDGKVLAYAAFDASGRRSVWLRSMDRGTTRALPGTNDAVGVFWRPDGEVLGFTTNNGDLKKVALEGGEVETIATRTTGASWNRDDVILVLPPLKGFPVARITASGGEPVVVLRPESIGADVINFPSFLPDGKHFLFLARGGEVEKRRQSGIWIGSLDTSERPRFLIPTRSVTHALYVQPGFLLFAREGVLRAQRFDVKSLQPNGDALSIAPVQSFLWSTHFTASDSGLLVYQPAGSAQLSRLELRRRDGTVARTFGNPAVYCCPRFSPDGRQVAVDLSDDRAVGDIWLFRTEDGGGSRFSFDRLNESTPVWSASGDEVAYGMELPPRGIVTLRKRLGTSPTTLAKFPGASTTLSDWSPDGRFLLLMRFGFNGQPNFDAMAWSLAEQKLISIVATASNEGMPVFSPDGRWIAYQSDESGRYEIYVQPFPPTGAKYQISTNGGVTARWSRHGEIFWVDANNRLTLAVVATTPSFQVSPPATLFPIDQLDPYSPQYDVGPDGTIVVNTLVQGEGKPMTLVVNWQKRLE
jgi:Tol biopolymer transport system component